MGIERKTLRDVLIIYKGRPMKKKGSYIFMTDLIKSKSVRCARGKNKLTQLPQSQANEIDKEGEQ